MSKIEIITMPKLGLTMTDGMVAEWPIKEGVRFSRGDVFLVVETEKTNNDIEAPEGGVITRILVAQGESVEVGTPLAEWESDGPGGEVSATPAPAITSDASKVPVRIAASPLQVKTAQRMVEAKRDIPHFYLSTEVNVGHLQAGRAKWNSGGNRPHASLTHLLLAAIAHALRQFPELNRVWDGNGFLRYEGADVGIAVDTPRGLVAPVVRNVDRQGLAALSREVSKLVERARSDKLVVGDSGGAMMSVSNAGMHDVTWMASIINPGQAAILGVGAQREQFRPDESGSPRLTREIGLILSCDHRALTGVEGLLLLNAIKAVLEAPAALFKE